MSSDKSALASLRNEVREWLAHNIPSGWQKSMIGVGSDEFVEFQREWFKKLVEAGYAAPHWPKEWGGGGMSLEEQVVIYEEVARADAPRLILFFISLYHAASTLIEWGTDEQKRRHLPAILNGEVWCQGFSEPNAGSDLASLQTRAEKRGDKYIINGQKVWSTVGQYADFCLLLARTDKTAPKHRGISFFLVDMNSKGIETRPIKQISGDEEFSEIFFENVEVPAQNLVGEENQGWRVAQTTLSSERGLTILELSERLRRGFGMLMDIARQGGDGNRAVEDDELSREIADLYTRISGLRRLIKAFMTNSIQGKDVAFDASVIKVVYSETLRQYTDIGLRIKGIEGQYFEEYLLGGGYETNNWMFDFFCSYHWTIAGGSNEIQRNIISERILGMPR